LFSNANNIWIWLKSEIIMNLKQIIVTIILLNGFDRWMFVFSLLTTTFPTNFIKRILPQNQRILTTSLWKIFLYYEITYNHTPDHISMTMKSHPKITVTDIVSKWTNIGNCIVPKRYFRRIYQRKSMFSSI